MASPAAGSGGTSSHNLQQLKVARGGRHPERYALDHDGSGGTGGAPVVDAAVSFGASRSSFGTQVLQ